MSEELHNAATPVGPPRPAARGAPERARHVGEVVAGRYELVRFLARGGMGEVWQGIHTDLRTDVAVKFLDPELAADPVTGQDTLARFRFEAQISAQISARTRHVVAVQDAGTHEGVPYLVMEYVPGRNLDVEVEVTGPLPPARFADVLDQAADALGAAHALGIVHRDIKPSNLLLHDLPDGKLMVKVADFGVAKAFDTTLSVDKPRETQQGQLVGSPAFMSPEQLRGAHRLDARSDIWSLGVVAYETLTGQSCFEGATVMDVFAAICVRRYRPASLLKKDLPPGIDAWIARALEVSPGDRFASVDQMARAFRALLSKRARSARPLAAAVLVTAALGAGGLIIARVRAEAPTSAPPPPAPTLTPVATAQPAPTTSSSPAPVAVNIADLPAAETAHGRTAPQKPRPTATAAPAPPTAAPAVTTAAPAPPVPTTPPSTTMPRSTKGIDKSEIQ